MVLIARRHRKFTQPSAAVARGNLDRSRPDDDIGQIGPCNNRAEVDFMASLRDLRAERLLSVRELARQASVAPSTIFLIEAGRTIPRQRVARQIARALHVEPIEV